MARTRVATLALALSLGASLALPNVPALADPPAAEAGGRIDGPAGASEPTAETAETADIALDTTTAENQALSAVLVELLERSGVRVRFSSMARFDPESLLSGGETDRAVRVFIDTSAGPKVHLYFRGPLAKRFLLRDLELRGGLDELGREAVAQVVGASVTALLHSSAGMSREQTKQALGVFGAQSTPEPRAREEPRPPAPGGEAPSPSAWFGLRYAAQWTGADLGGAHGPGAEIGVQWGRAPFGRASVSGERWFSQSVSSPQILATLQTTSLRAGVEFGWPLGPRQAGLLGVAGGMDLIGIAPAAPAASPVAPSEARTHVVPMGRVTLRYELAFGVWRIAIAGFADAAILATHYDVQRGGTYEQIADPWPLRPGAAVVLAWQPALGRQ